MAYRRITDLRLKDEYCKAVPGCRFKQLERKEQALDEIEEYFKNKDKSQTSLFNIFVIEQEILDIINKAKEI